MVWRLQLAYPENFREEKQSVSTAHTKDGQKETEAEGEGERKRDGESGSLKLGQRQNEQRRFLSPGLSHSPHRPCAAIANAPRHQTGSLSRIN